jgi:pimeloyl-ACP methyl ester carboxylesterase
MKILSLFFTIFFLSSQFLLALNPSRTYKQKPDKYNMKYKEVKVKTLDGAMLNVWDFPANVSTTKLVLIAHNGEGNMADYLRRVDQFTSTGYNVVVFDYRGYGESSEFEIDNNMYIYPHFQADLKAMIDYCRKQHVATFDLYGWGMGAGLSLGLGWNRREIKRIIADTPFFSMEDLEERFSSWDEPMEVPFAGYDKKHEPFYSMGNPPIGDKKVFFIIGSNDILYKVDDMKTLQAKQKKLVVKEIFVVENPDRKDNFKLDKAAYFKRISEFLKG